MNKNKAKEFLRQVKKLDCMIENKIAEKEHWKAIATGTTMQLTERVQTSSSQQKMADAVTRYVSIEDEINECIDRLINAKREIISVIEKLDVTEYDLLHKVYVQGLTLYQVADIYDRTYSCITTIHGRALKNVRKLLDEVC